MYRVLKPRGNASNVTVENTDTRASVTIGRINPKIIDILQKQGHAVGTDAMPLSEDWSLAVNEDTAKELASMAFKMTKPIRDQRKPETKKQANKQIDAMDVMLGLANYSK